MDLSVSEKKKKKSFLDLQNLLPFREQSSMGFWSHFEKQVFNQEKKKGEGDHTFSTHLAKVICLTQTY